MKQVQGLGSLHHLYDAVLIDAWGVLYDGGQIHDAARHALERLCDLPPVVVIVSNAARREAQLRRELERAGIRRDLYTDVVSSGELTWQALRQGLDFAPAGAAAFYLGPERSRALCDGLDFDWVDSPAAADFVLNAGAPGGNPANADSFVPQLEQMRARNLPMVCANPDLYAIRHGELGISAGAIAAAYRDLGGTVISYGKPERDIFERALARAGYVDRGRALMIGDAFATDIAGAVNAGIDSLLVASGIHAAELVSVGQVTVSRLAAVYGVSPDYFCERLSW